MARQKKSGYVAGTVVSIHVPGQKQPMFGVVLSQNDQVVWIQELLKDGTVRRQMVSVNGNIITEVIGHKELSGLCALLAKEKRFTLEMLAHCTKQEDLLVLADMGYLQHVWKKLPYRIVFAHCLKNRYRFSSEMIEACTDQLNLLMLAKHGYLMDVWQRIPYEAAVDLAVLDMQRKCQIKQGYRLGRAGVKGAAQLMADVYARAKPEHLDQFELTDEEVIACFTRVPTAKLALRFAILQVESGNSTDEMLVELMGAFGNDNACMNYVLEHLSTSLRSKLVMDGDEVSSEIIDRAREALAKMTSETKCYLLKDTISPLLAAAIVNSALEFFPKVSDPQQQWKFLHAHYNHLEFVRLCKNSNALRISIARMSYIYSHGVNSSTSYPDGREPTRVLTHDQWRYRYIDEGVGERVARVVRRLIELGTPKRKAFVEGLEHVRYEDRKKLLGDLATELGFDSTKDETYY